MAGMVRKRVLTQIYSFFIIVVNLGPFLEKAMRVIPIHVDDVVAIPSAAACVVGGLPPLQKMHRIQTNNTRAGHFSPR